MNMEKIGKNNPDNFTASVKKVVRQKAVLEQLQGDSIREHEEEKKLAVALKNTVIKRENIILNEQPYILKETAAQKAERAAQADERAKLKKQIESQNIKKFEIRRSLQIALQSKQNQRILFGLNNDIRPEIDAKNNFKIQIFFLQQERKKNNSYRTNQITDELFREREPVYLDYEIKFAGEKVKQLNKPLPSNTKKKENNIDDNMNPVHIDLEFQPEEIDKIFIKNKTEPDRLIDLPPENAPNFIIACRNKTVKQLGNFLLSAAKRYYKNKIKWDINESQMQENSLNNVHKKFEEFLEQKGSLVSFWADLKNMLQTSFKPLVENKEIKNAMFVLDKLAAGEQYQHAEEK